MAPRRQRNVSAWVVGGAVATAVIGGGAYLLTRRRRRGLSGSSESEELANPTAEDPLWRDAVKAFIVGSSLPAGAVTLTYLGRAHSKSKPQPLTYEAVPFEVLGALGAANSISVMVQRTYGTNPLATQAIAGALTGLAFSAVGRSAGLPQKIFGFTDESAPLVHVIAPAMYSAIFAGILYPLNKLVLDPKETS